MRGRRRRVVGAQVPRAERDGDLASGGARSSSGVREQAQGSRGERRRVRVEKNMGGCGGGSGVEGPGGGESALIFWGASRGAVNTDAHARRLPGAGRDGANASTSAAGCLLQCIMSTSRTLMQARDMDHYLRTVTTIPQRPSRPPCWRTILEVSALLARATIHAEVDRQGAPQGETDACSNFLHVTVMHSRVSPRH
ncbi:hypothetical protein M011DRAFT_55254 [Sporormia fimetaria CBS 119925]|uniref:Uncharacterized protein n=1 Tax=Sporormia fimetaria CBS 119925 TaxID=1340428 RepID=A0A6A6VDP9_9PLEO|nr:hypothetical protein M011DRAFT_55254 [Sporormia fimetaria CBS 119925]